MNMMVIWTAAGFLLWLSTYQKAIQRTNKRLEQHPEMKDDIDPAKIIPTYRILAMITLIYAVAFTFFRGGYDYHMWMHLSLSVVPFFIFSLAAGLYYIFHNWRCSAGERLYYMRKSGYLLFLFAFLPWKIVAVIFPLVSFFAAFFRTEDAPYTKWKRGNCIEYWILLTFASYMINYAPEDIYVRLFMYAFSLKFLTALCDRVGYFFDACDQETL